jgi:hypothetical protein
VFLIAFLSVALILMENKVHTASGAAARAMKIKTRPTKAAQMVPKTTYGSSCGLYYKHITIVNDDSRVVNK